MLMKRVSCTADGEKIKKQPITSVIGLVLS